ncbi:SDR family NAD(P)-dependent oxidoreductase [Halomarina salina]|uniref:SDR family NAD(P)-dependent oxidoreductase n=1 Tax=Halomarina salina TaxID=1872699 RepID=A0ABD5RT70_9EURY|nr:SDR family oxidoreductase [Halomarina salina]
MADDTPSDVTATPRTTDPTENAVPGRFDGKTALVTGSTRGIGEGVARRFAAEGAAVVVTGRSAEPGEAVVEDIRDAGGAARFVRADMRDPDDIEVLVGATVEEYGGLDVLVNNAGVQTETTAQDATMDDWAFVVETDFRSFWLGAKHAVEHMGRGASVLNMSSNHALLTMPGLFPYNAVKAGIDGMTRAMALDFSRQGVRVNTINPGWVEIARTREELADVDRERVEAMHPTGRIGTPADVAGVAAFLASDDAAFVTGASLVVDGGRSAVMEDDAYVDYRTSD